MQEFNFLTPGSKNQGQTIEITSEKKTKNHVFTKGLPSVPGPAPHCGHLGCVLFNLKVEHEQRLVFLCPLCLVLTDMCCEARGGR